MPQQPNDLMTVDEARNLIKILESARAGRIKLWNFEKKRLTVARTIVAQAERIERLESGGQQLGRTLAHWINTLAKATDWDP